MIRSKAVLGISSISTFERPPDKDEEKKPKEDRNVIHTKFLSITND
jgi:hypothetical protein